MSTHKIRGINCRCGYCAAFLKPSNLPCKKIQRGCFLKHVSLPMRCATRCDLLNHAISLDITRSVLRAGNHREGMGTYLINWSLVWFCPASQIYESSGWGPSHPLLSMNGQVWLVVHVAVTSTSRPTWYSTYTKQHYSWHVLVSHDIQSRWYVLL